MIQLNLPPNSIILVKVDYNISSLNDTYRIEMSKPTIGELISQNYKVVLITHYGRPVNQESEFSTKNILETVSKTLGQEVEYFNQFESFDKAKNKIINSNSKVFLLENTRFDKSESSQDTEARLQLAKNYQILGQYLIDEAFSVSHRSEVTNTELNQLLPNHKGLRYLIEIQNLDNLKTPEKPFYIYMGGAKVKTKLPIIKNLITRADKIFIGGMICFTFLKVQEEMGIKIPPLFDSPIEEESKEEVRTLLEEYSSKLVLPIDLVYKSVDGKILAGDVGSLTTNIFCNSTKEANSIFWNGAFGQVEIPNLDYSSKSFVQALIENQAAYVVVGGGDTEAFIQPKQKEKIDFVSTGGGATLDYISKF